MLMIIQHLTNGTHISSRIDISDEFSFEHAIQFAKLGAAFAIELGGWEKRN
jgi:hypothetical protein